MAGSGGGVPIIGKSGPAPDEVGIVFLHHATDEVTRHHYDLIRRHNPGVPIVSVSGSYDRLESGLVAKHLTWNNHRWWRETHGGNPKRAWGFQDLMLYGAVAQTPYSGGA